MEVMAFAASDFVRALRARLRISQRELAERAWLQKALIARIELGREPRLPTLRRLTESLGGRLELIARFERPLDALAADFQRERDERRVGRNWERRMARRAAAAP